MNLLLAVDLISKDEQQRELLGCVQHSPDSCAIGCRRPPDVALLLELLEVISLAGATEEVFLPWPADNLNSVICLVSIFGALWGLPLKMSSAGS